MERLDGVFGQQKSDDDDGDTADDYNRTPLMMIIKELHIAFQFQYCFKQFINTNFFNSKNPWEEGTIYTSIILMRYKNTEGK